MKLPISNTYGLRAKSSRAFLVAGLACSAPSIANPADISLHNPANLLPRVFTRIEYINPTQPTQHRSTAVRSAAPNSLRELDFVEPISRNDRTVQSAGSIQSDTYAQQDLDLALENFFYALEDLMQSASRYQEVDPTTGTDAYAAQVQFPAQVMAGFTPSVATDRATNAATASNAATTLPPTTVSAATTTGGTFLDDFNYSSALGMNVAHNDNIYTTYANPVTDIIARTNANGVAESRSRKSALKFEGNINTGNYYDNPDNNYVDWDVTGSFSTLLSQRSKAFMGIGYFYHHEDKGVGSTDGDQDFTLGEPIEFESWVARGIYERGTKQTRARLVADGKIDQLRTTNFQNISAIKSRDRDINSLIGTAFYNWSQRLSYLAELRHLDITYVNPASADGDSLDSTQTRYAVGVEWLATRKTAGSIRIGLQEKNYATLANSDTKNISWEAIVEWAPRARTEMILETIQDTEESDGFGTARDRTDLKITWKQKWTPRIDTRTSLQYGTTDFQQQIRKDELALIDAELTYSLNSSTSAALKLTYIDNSSNVVEYGFQRSQIQLGVDMEL